MKTDLTGDVIEAAIAVHRELGPGLLESTYETCLEHELVQRGFQVERQKPLPVFFKDVKLDAGYWIDLLVEGEIVIEVKAVEALAPVHEAQVLTYLKLSGRRFGLLINFNVPLLKDGIRRLVNGYGD